MALQPRPCPVSWPAGRRDPRTDPCPAALTCLLWQRWRAQGGCFGAPPAPFRGGQGWRPPVTRGLLPRPLVLLRPLGRVGVRLGGARHEGVPLTEAPHHHHERFVHHLVGGDLSTPAPRDLELPEYESHP